MVAAVTAAAEAAIMAVVAASTEAAVADRMAAEEATQEADAAKEKTRPEGTFSGLLFCAALAAHILSGLIFSVE